MSTHRNAGTRRVDPGSVPGWTGAGTLLLPIAPAAWPVPATPLSLDGIAFVPKRELHVTVVGRALGAELVKAGLRDAVASACAPLDWRFLRCERWLRLQDRSGGRRRDSIIERIELPALGILYATLGALLGRQPPVPPAHVTLYTAGDEHGIGVPDATVLARRTVRRIDAGELGTR